MNHAKSLIKSIEKNMQSFNKIPSYSSSSSLSWSCRSLLVKEDSALLFFLLGGWSKLKLYKRMGEDSFRSSEDNFDWDSEDDREIDGIASACPGSKAISVAGSSGSKLIDHFIAMGFNVKAVSDAIQEYGEENSSLILEALCKEPVETSDDSAINHFVGMGFPKEMVAKVIQEIGDSNKTDSILETLLTYREIEKVPQKQPTLDYDSWSSDCEENAFDDFSDLEDSINEAFLELESDEESEGPLACLTRMGYSKNEATIALERCGPGTSIPELIDFLSAAHQAKADDLLYPNVKPNANQIDSDTKLKKRSLYELEVLKKHQRLRVVKNPRDGDDDDDEPLRLPKPMIGFGVPTEPELGYVTERNLPEAAKGPPFFYYENIALAPKGVWRTMSSHLYDVEPEFVDSKYFCAAARKRGYIHNLPIHNRFPLLPLPKLTVQEALPLTKRWWPSWDPRTKLNCIQTVFACGKTTERILKAIAPYEEVPPRVVQEYILNECRKWNLVWLGKNKVAPLEPDEVETLLGFPKNHTRGGGINRTDRYKSLGNSFQVDTVAYHLSPLKHMFPDGINVLSLFSGIGGAEVSLYKLGIRLKNLVSVEISSLNRDILRCWWEQTDQRGRLIEIPDVRDLSASRLEHYIGLFGGFDLVIGGSPCNNLAGSNRLHRHGLAGADSSLFFDFSRILELVKLMMNNRL